MAHRQFIAHNHFQTIVGKPEQAHHVGHVAARFIDELGDFLLGQPLAIGQTLIGAEIAARLGVSDRGVDRPSYRDMLGSPRPKNPAAVY